MTGSPARHRMWDLVGPTAGLNEHLDHFLHCFDAPLVGLGLHRAGGKPRATVS